MAHDDCHEVVEVNGEGEAGDAPCADAIPGPK